MSKVTINPEQKWYVIPCGAGYSCMGFDVVQRKVTFMEKEYNQEPCNHPHGSIELYERYNELVEIARLEYTRSGKRSEVNIAKKLLPFLGKRVEVTYTWGETERFIVGKSTGWCPTLLARKRRDSSGGSATMGDDSIKSVRLVG